jgi:segregation and condensation protein B
MDTNFLDGAIESILFVSGEPVNLVRLAAVFGVGEFEIEAAANRVRDKLAFERRGIRLVKLDNSFQLCSSPEYADYIRLALETRKPPQLSPAALEVLAIIAYFQPVTKAYIEQIRGVDSAYTVGLLVDRGLIESCGRLAVPGRPMIYKTTHVFLRTFGIETIEELPELPEVESKDESSKESIRHAIMALKAQSDANTDDNADDNANDYANNNAYNNANDYANNNAYNNANDNADENPEG